MTEEEVNGTRGGELDLPGTKAALSASSTTVRLERLHALEERLSTNGTEACSLIAQICRMLFQLAKQSIVQHYAKYKVKGVRLSVVSGV